MYHIGMLLFVKQVLTSQQRTSLVNSLKHTEGVLLANFTPGRQHLLTVEYCPGKINSGQVLGHVKQSGIDAEYYSY